MANRREFVLGMGTVGLLAAAPSAARAQADYPNRPIRMLVGFAPGGPTDIVARQLAQYMSPILGQSIVIENRGGANGNIATSEVASASPDGYTVLYNTSAIAISPALYPSLSYDAKKSFASVGLSATVPMVLQVNPQLPVQNVKDLIEYLKVRGEQVSYASTGNGSITHLASALFLSKHQLKATHVPYRGSAPALVDLSTGRVNFMTDTINSSLPFILDGRLRPLAVTSARRLDALPNIPTLAEIGALETEMGAWQGILVPAGTPAPMIAKLNDAMMKALHDPAFRAKLAEQQTTPLGSTPEAYTRYILDEIERWAQVVKDNQIGMN